MNVLMIEGRLTRDAEQRFTQAGTAVAGFTVASDVGYGEKKKTLFMGCSLWGKRAEGSLVQYLTKGAQVVVHGELQPNDWTDKNGNKRNDIKLNVSDIKLVGGKGTGESKQSLPTHGGSQGKPVDPFASAPDFGNAPVDDDLPF